ncbi:MAG TPA: sigma-70 family RNA polymerase sigma factor [Polyangiaceae bacterium]|nr:sigma-70 family RNA polymerase sigma factor [Polyangiaceae bacterium]
MTEKQDSNREGTDEALMVRYQRGDRNALAIIVKRYARPVYATAYWITGNVTAAAEAAQNAFLALVGQAGSFHIEMRFRSWLYGFLHQLLTSRFQTDLRVLDSTNPGALPSNAENTEMDPAHHGTRASRSQLVSRRVAECVESLPPLEREAIVMKLVAQLTLAELSAAIGADGDTTRARLRYAFDRLRESVSDTEDYARALR